MARTQAPCLNCTKRVSACHDNCDEFAEYKDTLKQIAHAKRNASNAQRVTGKVTYTRSYDSYATKSELYK